MNNSVYGKTMENLRKRIRVDLVRASENVRMRRLVADPAYLSHKIFNGDLVAMHSTKRKLKLNRSIYVGEFSKTPSSSCMTSSTTILRLSTATR